MKTKLLAIVLSLLMLVQPVMAIGMVGMESATEIAATIPEEVQDETQEAEVMSAATDVHPDHVIFFDDFEGNEVKDWGVGAASYTLAYQNGDTTVKLTSTDQSTETVDGVSYPSKPHWSIVDEEGDKVLLITQYTGQHNNAGFDFNGLKFLEPGVYTLSFDLKLELGENAEGFGPKADVDYCWFQVEKSKDGKFVSGDGPSNSGINATNGAKFIGNWKTVIYKYVITANDDGTRTIAPAISNMNSYRNPDGYHTYAEGEYLSRIRHYFKLYPAGKAQGKIYLDDMKLTYSAPITVTYKDVNGKTLATDTTKYQGDYVTVAGSVAGVEYPVVFTVNGTDYAEGTKLTFGYDETDVVVTVKSSIPGIPANAKPNAVLYEDFETAVVDPNYNYFPYAEGDYARVTYNQYQNAFSFVADPENANNRVAKITANSGGTVSYNAGIRMELGKTPISEPGTYIVSYKYRISPQITGEGNKFTKAVNHMRFNKANGNDNSFYSSDLTDITTYNTWREQTTSVEIFVKDGTKYLSMNGATPVEFTNDIWDIIIHNESHYSAKDIGTCDWYYDDLTLQYYPATDIKYVNEAGTTLYTEKRGLNNYTFATKATLGTSFYPAYYVNGEEIIANKATVETDADELVITVKPNARIFYEDFETGFTVGEALKVPYTAETPNWTRATLNGIFRREGRSENVKSGDESVSEDGTLYTNQEWYVVDQGNGNKALKITATRGRWNAAGLKFENFDISKAGTYHLSFDVAGVHWEGATWGDGQGTISKDGDKIVYNVAAGEFGQPGGIGISATPTSYKHVDYTIVATDNGDGTFNYNMTNRTTENGLLIKTGGSKTYTNVTAGTSVRTCVYFGAASDKLVEVYVDNIEFTYGQDVTVTYKDAKGATLKTLSATQGQNFVLEPANASVNYAAKYEINGDSYTAGDIYKIPADSTGETITAVKYSMDDAPESVSENAIYHEGFDILDGLTVNKTPVTYYDETYFTETVPAIYDYGGTKTYTTFDGKKVLSIENSSSYVGVRFRNLNLNKAGRYTLTYSAYIDTSKGTPAKTTDMALNVYYINASGAEAGAGKDSSNFDDLKNAANYNKWVTIASDIILTERDGKLYRGSTEVPSINNVLWYTNWGNTAVVTKYMDYATMEYFAPVTVKVVDTKGATLATHNVYQTDTITLPNIRGYFTFGDATYNSGATFTVPAKAASEITITAQRFAMPNTVPANTVVYEDFEDKTIGATVAANHAHYTVEAFDGTTVNQCEGSTVSKTYEKTPDGEDNKALKIVSNATYSNSMLVNLPDDIEVGRYNVSWRFYIDNDKKTDDGSAYLNSISAWCRVWYGPQVKDADGKETDDGFVGASTNIAFNSASNRKNWNTYSFDFEIFEEGGKKYAKMGGESHVITGDVYLKLHTTSSNADKNSNTIYHDDLIITQVKPTAINATFVDENGEALDYIGTYLGYDAQYKLPTADDMGIDYLVEFVGEDGKTYYPNTICALPENTTETTFVVKKSNVIFYEDFEGLTKTAAYVTPTYAAGPMADATMWANRINNNVNGTKSNVVSANNGTNQTTEFIKLATPLSTPGIYKVTIDVQLKIEKKAETDVVDNNFYVNFQTVGGWNNAGNNVYLREPNELKKTINAYIEIIDNGDGTSYRLQSSTGTLRDTAINTLRTGLIWSDAYRNATGTKATYHMSFDNVKIEYIPFSPANTNKASYRAINDGDNGGPEGIRFAAYVSNDQREVASEYGFVVTRKALLTTEGKTDYTKLNLKGIDSVSATNTTTGKNSDGVAVVAAAAYNGTVDRIYIQDGKVFGLQGLYDTFYTAVLYGLDSDARKAEVFVARPYAKVGGVYYYGDCHETSYNEVKAAAEAANA